MNSADIILAAVSETGGGAETPPNHGHVKYCWDVLYAHLIKSSPQPSPLDNLQEIEDEKFPLFITWKHHKSQRLRGCIGNFSALPLRKGLRDYSLIAALQDSRFKPVTISELVELECTVSLLVNFEECAHENDWKVGTHGLRLEFSDTHDRLRSSTFLPQVALEQGWSRAETLDHLVTKAGFKGRFCDLRSFKLTRYLSKTCSLSYHDYISLSLSKDGGNADIPGKIIDTSDASSTWNNIDTSLSDHDDSDQSERLN